MEAAVELGATVIVVVPAVSRSAVRPGASVTVLLSDEMGVEAGWPLTWYNAGVPVEAVVNKLLLVPSLSWMATFPRAVLWTESL